MTTNREFALLKSLNDSHPYGMPKSALFADVNIRLARNHVMTHGDFDMLLRDVEAKRRIQSLTGEDDVTLKITEDGRHRLLELRG
jgi:hypothetical protein